MFHQQSITRDGRGGKNDANLYIDPKDMKNWQMVCSVYPAEFHVSTAHGDFVIPAKPEGKPYAWFKVPPGWTRRDSGNGQYNNDMNIQARVVAQDVIAGKEDRGVFIPAGEIATEQEVHAAIERRNHRWLTKDIPEADSVWSKTRDPRAIDENAKRAVKVLGIKKEWAGHTEFADTAECPRCKENIKTGAEICRHCRLEPILWDGKVPRRAEPASVAAGGKR